MRGACCVALEDECLHSALITRGTDSRLRRRCAGTHIVEDCERFSQRFAQQADPFGKQLVQMFAEMLTDNNTG